MADLKHLSVALVVAASFATPAAAQEKLAIAEVMQVGDAAVVGGTVVPYKEVVLAAQTPGLVRFIAGREGDTFRSNTLLVQIDDDDLQARRRASVAEITAAQNAQSNARIQYSRELISPTINRNLTRPTGFGVPSMFDYFMSRPMSNFTGQSNTWVERYADLHTQSNAFSEASGRLARAWASLEEIDTKIRDARLAAPFDGVIVAKLVEVGDTVQPGQALLRFAYVDYLRIQAEVPVRLVASLERGMFVPARLDVGTGIIVNARVSQIYPIADQSRHTVTVKFDLPRGVPGGPGMYAEIRVPDAASQAKQVPTVPRRALVQRGSLLGVYVMRDGEPTLRLVRVGSATEGDRVTIISGLKGGEQVVVDPPRDLGNRGKSAEEE